MIIKKYSRFIPKGLEKVFRSWKYPLSNSGFLESVAGPGGPVRYTCLTIFPYDGQLNCD